MAASPGETCCTPRAQCKAREALQELCYSQRAPNLSSPWWSLHGANPLGVTLGLSFVAWKLFCSPASFSVLSFPLGTLCQALSEQGVSLG